MVFDDRVGVDGDRSAGVQQGEAELLELLRAAVGPRRDQRAHRHAARAGAPSSSKISVSLHRNSESEISRVAPRIASRMASRHSAGDATTRSGRFTVGRHMLGVRTQPSTSVFFTRFFVRRRVELFEVRPRLLAVAGAQIRHRVVQRHHLGLLRAELLEHRLELGFRSGTGRDRCRSRTVAMPSFGSGFAYGVSTRPEKSKSYGTG